MSSSTSSPSSPPTSTPPTTDSSSSPSFGTATPAPRASGYLSNDPTRTGFDPKTQWWVNYFNILAGRVTPEGIHHYREWRYAENEARDCKRCEEQVQWVFNHSPIVRFMAERVNELNGDISPKNVFCRRCPARVDPKTGAVSRMEAGFNIDSGILLCANEVQGKKRTEDVLAHEMVHAYDHLRWKSDIKGNMKHAACTEIRAAMLSGECRWSREAFGRGNWTLTQQFQRCVRTRAVQSMMARPQIKDDVHATKTVNEVWDSCFSDTRPFDEVYK